MRLEEIYVFFEDVGKVVWGYEVLCDKKTKTGLGCLFKNFTSGLDFEIFKKHCKDLMNLNDSDFNCDFNRFSLNLYAQTLLSHREEIDFIIKRLERKKRIEIFIEITERGWESLSFQEIKQISAIFKDRIVVDDFGKGDSNFDKLKILDPVMIKIDLRIIPLDLAIFLAKFFSTKMKKTVIFEKVESARILKKLLRKGFIGKKFLYQGFLFENSLKQKTWL